MKEEFNVNNVAFEIHECYAKGELTADFTRAWKKEWNTKQRYSIRATTVLGDVLIYNRREGIIIINDKVIYINLSTLVNKS